MRDNPQKVDDTQDWTAEEILKRGIKEFQVVVYGFEFKIECCDKWGSTELYISPNSERAALIAPPNIELEPFQTISSVRDYILDFLDAAREQLNDFAADYEKAFEKHYRYTYDPRFAGTKDRETKIAETKAYLLKRPYDIFNYDIGTLLNDVDFMQGIYIEVKRFGIKADFETIFAKMKKEDIVEVYERVTKDDAFAKKAVIRALDPQGIAERLFESFEDEEIPF